MIKLTLDTNCIINLLDYKSQSAISVDELAEIIRYGFEGDVNIAITTRVDSDVSKDKNTDRKGEILKRISMFPVIGTVARLNTSKLDSGVLFFGALMPLVLKTTGGVFLPPLFALGTGLPVIIFSFLIAFSMQKVSKAFQVVQKIEKVMRYVVASIFIVAGVYYLQYLIKYLVNLW